VTVTRTPAAAGRAPGLGHLLRSEVLRARSRRSLRWLSILALLGVVGIAAIMWFTSARVTADDLTAAAEQFRAEQQQAYEMCLSDPNIPEAERPNVCWKPTEQDVLDNAIWTLPRRPFDRTGLEGLVSFAGGIGLLVAVMLAATAGGADWGARTMGLLLSWEPRRTRVFSVRLVVVLGVALAVEAAMVLLAVALGSVIAGAHDLDLPPGTTLANYQAVDLGEAVELALRWLPLAALGAAGSFAVAMLTRSTGWAIGALIGFVAVVESILQGLWPWGSQWLLQTNAAAWLTGGVTKLVDRAAAERSGGYAELADGLPPGYIVISDTRGLTTLATMVAVACLVSWITLRQRDVE
jgi:ABC-2 type transport system permease protein